MIKFRFDLLGDGKKCATTVKLCIPVIGVELECLFEIFNRLLQIPSVCVKSSASDQPLNVFRVNFKALERMQASKVC